jgi:hypothetical protein
MIGGLLVSVALTLSMSPVISFMQDRLHRRLGGAHFSFMRRRPMEEPAE